MAKDLNDNFNILAGKPVDKRYYNTSNTPYTSVAQVNSTVPKAYRYIGLTVRIVNVEYEYYNGVEDANLLPKAFAPIAVETLTFHNTEPAYESIYDIKTTNTGYAEIGWSGNIPSDSIYAIVPNKADYSDQVMFYASGQNLLRIDGNVNDMVIYNRVSGNYTGALLPANNFVYLAPNGATKVYISAGQTGLIWCMDFATPTPVCTQITLTGATGAVSKIVYDAGRNVIWARVTGFGVVRYNVGANTTVVYSSASGNYTGDTLSNLTADIVFSNTLVWISTTQGLFKFLPDTAVSTKYSTTNGLPSNSLGTMVSNGTYIFVAVTTGSFGIIRITESTGVNKYYTGNSQNYFGDTLEAGTYFISLFNTDDLNVYFVGGTTSVNWKFDPATETFVRIPVILKIDPDYSVTARFGMDGYVYYGGGGVQIVEFVAENPIKIVFDAFGMRYDMANPDPYIVGKSLIPKSQLEAFRTSFNDQLGVLRGVVPIEIVGAGVMLPEANQSVLFYSGNTDIILTIPVSISDVYKFSCLILQDGTGKVKVQSDGATDLNGKIETTGQYDTLSIAYYKDGTTYICK